MSVVHTPTSVSSAAPVRRGVVYTRGVVHTRAVVHTRGGVVHT